MAIGGVRPAIKAWESRVAEIAQKGQKLGWGQLEKGVRGSGRMDPGSAVVTTMHSDGVSWNGALS